MGLSQIICVKSIYFNIVLNIGRFPTLQDNIFIQYAQLGIYTEN